MLAPTLIVGLGGTGSDIVQRVAKRVSDKQRQRIAFVAVDTDVNELREISNKNPYIRTVQTSTKLSVGEYLNIDTHARDNWFPVNKILSRKTLTEGAGQVRAISRLALDTAIRAGNLEPLHKAIEDLYKLETGKRDQALRVIIVSSLAGGTGSGLILPIAMYIKNFLTTRFQQSANITRGFFVLPEVFYEVIKGQAERNNLRCNAYATLRELDAFLMKGDATLPEQYKKTLRLEFPRVGSTECEEYDVMPYDFCFLFDAQNIDGKKLNSFNQYKDHAASCIYAQSIGPMNKRSNSSEDNTILDLCKSGGRSRYAGAGSSMLIYPFEDVKNYVALQWAKQCVSHQWLVFDRQFKEKSVQNNEMRSRGYNVRDLDPAQDYIASVQAAADQKNPFGSYIVNSCGIFDSDGLNRTSDKWLEYVGNLKAYIDATCSSGQRDLDMQREDAQGSVSRLGQEGNNGWDSFYNAYSELSKYKGMVYKRSEETARAIAYTMFKAENTSITKDRFKHQLESYLRNESDEFIHPNAARYFLYQTLDCLRKEKQMADNDIRDCDDFFEHFEQKAFDDDRTDDVQETAEDLTNRKLTIRQKITKKLSSDQEDLLQKYKKYLETVNEYRVTSIYAEVLREGIEYVNGLCKAFQTFYNFFEGSVTGIEREISVISSKYEGIKGNATRYVCASPSCFEKFNAKMPFTGSALNLSSELCDKIYMQIRAYAMMADKPSRDSFFIEIFNEDILGYFRDSVMQSYGKEIDMDIIQALEMEAQFEKDIFDRGHIELYVKEALYETKLLSEPFIEKPLGEQKTVISACTFNPALDQVNNPVRHNLINQELGNDGGCADDDIDKNMILFYKSIYGLRANELSKFAPPSKDGIITREAGEYFKSYFELISQIMPRHQETPVITPHIDRKWHLISNLPDLDEGNQKAQETEIYKALMYGLVFDKIQYRVISGKKTLYRLILPGSSADDFVVSNGTPCDSYNEVLDALTVNPIVVKKIIASVEKDFEKERLANKRVFFKDSLMKRCLENFFIEEYSDEPMSFFDIAIILKISTPAADFRDSIGIDLMQVMLDVIYEYMDVICPEDEVASMYGDFVLEQYGIYKKNLEWYIREWHDKFGSYIDSLYEVTAAKLLEKELDEQARLLFDDNKAFNRARRNRIRSGAGVPTEEETDKAL